MHTYTRIQSTAEIDEEQQREDAEFKLYTYSLRDVERRPVLCIASGGGGGKRPDPWPARW